MNENYYIVGMSPGNSYFGDEEVKFLEKSAENYVRDSAEYRGYVRSPDRLGAAED
jgi:hypothetical protein